MGWPNRTLTAKFKQARQQYTVTLIVAEWVNKQWGQKGDYLIYWPEEDFTIGKLSIKKTFYEGDICSFKYIAGSDGSGYYEYCGVRDIKRNSITDSHSLSFTVTSNVTYYVEMMYQRY